jgi:hypothetical protein
MGSGHLVVGGGSLARMVTADLVRRCGELKGELVAFTRASRFARRVTWNDVNRVDHFILQQRLPDGRTMIDLFVASRPDLTENERRIVLGWRDAVETVIEVRSHKDDTVEGVGVIDELSYRIHSTKPVQRLEVGSFLITRIVPVAADWLFSGESQSFPANSRQGLLRMAAQLAIEFPALLFRNPDVLAQAWEHQAADRRRFMDYFRSDMVVLPGRKLKTQMSAFNEYRYAEVTAATKRRPQRRSAPPMEFANALLESELVAVIYDEAEGMLMFPNFGTLDELFGDPELIRNGRYRSTLNNYLRDETVSPVLFRRLGQRHPDTVSVVFRKLLGKRAFDWSRDGEALLRKHKSAFLDRTPLPMVVPLSEKLVAATTGRRPSRPRRAKQPRAGRFYQPALLDDPQLIDATP